MPLKTPLEMQRSLSMEHEVNLYFNFNLLLVVEFLKKKNQSIHFVE